MFEVGQEVWDLLRGKGEVQAVEGGCPKVYFTKTRAHVRYQADGRISPMFNRSLFFSEPEIDALTAPPWVSKLLPGTICVAVDKMNGALWPFMVHSEDKNRVLGTNKISYLKSDYNICRLGEKVY